MSAEKYQSWLYNDRCRPTKMTDPSLKEKESPDDADRTFPHRHHPNIIEGLN